MPSGYVTYTEQWAVVGLFLAQTTYFQGPMMEVPSGSRLHSILREEWQMRWDNPTPP